MAFVTKQTIWAFVLQVRSAPSTKYCCYCCGGGGGGGVAARKLYD